MDISEKIRLRSIIKQHLMQLGYYIADENCHDVAQVLRHLADGWEEKETDIEL